MINFLRNSIKNYIKNSIKNSIDIPIVCIMMMPIFLITNVITTCVDIVPQLILMYYSTIKTPPIYIKYNNYDIPYELRTDSQTFTSHNNKIMFLDKNVIFFAQKQMNKKTNEIIYVVDKHDGTQLIYMDNVDNVDKYKLIL